MDQSTTQLTGEHDDSGRGADAAMPAVPALTVVYHPRLRRMGERLLMRELRVPGQDVEISRAAPCFSPPRTQSGTPLAEKPISRTPFRLRRAPGSGIDGAADGGIDIVRGHNRRSIIVDGAELGEQHRVTPDALKRGVLLELSGCVLLLLHEHTPPEEPESGDLGLVGESSAMVRVRADIKRVADLDVTVLLRGQTGTGKELVAEAIHAHSPRHRTNGKDMVSVNISTIPPTLAAAELFGANKGAYSGGAHQDGYFGRADGSTLFLDEIGEAPMDVQAMLLRVLETKKIQRLGTQRSDSIDVRVLAATDAPLDHYVAQGRFRDALLYRLRNYEIELPLLRERREDIGQLVLHFLQRELTDIGEPDRLDQATPWLPLSVMRGLVSDDWPGNVRDLLNAVRHLVIGNRGRAVAVMPEKLARRLDAGRRPTAAADAVTVAAPVSEPPPAPAPSPKRRPAEIPDEEIREALRAHRWEVQAAAAALGVARNTLYGRIETSRLMRSAKDIGAVEIQAALAQCNGDLDAMVDRLEISKGALKKRMSELGIE